MTFAVDAVKAWLSQYREDDKELDEQYERLEKLRVKMYGLGAQVITDMPVVHGGTNDRLTDLIAKKEEIDTSMKRLAMKHLQDRENIEKVVSELKSAEEKAIIRLRYVDALRWEDVNQVIFGKKDDFCGKEDSYLRRVFLTHGNALTGIVDLMQLDKYRELAEHIFRV